MNYVRDIELPIETLTSDGRDIEVSTVEECPWDDGLCCGSDDGGLYFLSRDRKSTSRLKRAAASSEAINGIAFGLRHVALSTRADVNVIVRDPTRGYIRSALVDRGAFGIYATSWGDFISPLGPDGLLMLRVVDESFQALITGCHPSDRINYYTLAHLSGDEKGDLFAAAARRDGLLAFTLTRDGTVKSHQFTADNLDVVATCSIATAEWPRAAAYLLDDSSILLFRDILGATPPEEAKFDAITGAGYSIREVRGSLVVLTNAGVHILPELVSEFLRTGKVADVSIVHSILREFVDIFKANDRVVLLRVDGMSTLDVSSIPRPEGLTMSKRSQQSTMRAGAWEALTVPEWAPIQIAVEVL